MGQGQDGCHLKRVVDEMSILVVAADDGGVRGGAGSRVRGAAEVSGMTRWTFTGGDMGIVLSPDVSIKPMRHGTEAGDT